MLCFVILHYKNVKDTLECLESIQKLNNQSKIKTIIIDNNTTTKEEENVLKKRGDYFLRLSENLGFAKANNIGCQKAVEKYSPDFLVVINNDIIIQQVDFVNKMEKDYQKYFFDMLGPKIITNGGNSVNPFPAYETKGEVEKAYNKTKMLIRIYQHKCTAWFLEKYLAVKHIFQKKIHLQNGTHLQKGVALHGCAIIFSRKYYEKHPHVFYPGTFLYHEEEFLNYRRKKENLIAIYDPKIRVFHKEGASLNYRFNQKEREKKLFRYQEIEKSLKKLLELYQEGEKENDK